MEATVKQYFLSPNFDYPPNGPIQLGRIFTSPKKLSDAVNPLPEHLIPNYRGPKSETSKEKFKSTVSHPDSKFKVGLFAGFLQQFLPASANLELQVNRNRESILYADKLKTEFFDPSDEYVSEALNVPAVLATVGKPNFFLRLFIVTGVKTVYGGSKASSTKTAHTSVSLDGRVDLGTVGAPGVSPGASIGGAGGPTKTLEWETADSPYVFAYRLKRIYYRRGKWVTEPYNRGALYELKTGQEANQDSGKSSQTPEANQEADTSSHVVKGSEAKTLAPEGKDDEGYRVIKEQQEKRTRVLINMVADKDLSVNDLDPAERESVVSSLVYDDDDGSECTALSLKEEGY